MAGEDLERRVRLGHSAAGLIEGDAFQAAVSATEEVVIEQFRKATTADEAWAARLRLRALGDLLGYLHAAKLDGEAARRQGEVAQEEHAQERAAAQRRDWLDAYRNKAREAWAKADAEIAAPEVSVADAEKELGDDGNPEG